MGPQTKQRAVAKLLAFTKKIGYPDNWVDYSTLADRRRRAVRAAGRASA